MQINSLKQNIPLTCQDDFFIGLSNTLPRLNSTAQIAIKSLEEGDTPRLHDTEFNPIAKQFFEIGTSIDIIQNPSTDTADVIDHYLKQAASLLQKVYSDDFKHTPVHFNYAPNKPGTLAGFMDQKVLKLHGPQSDQLTRCIDQVDPAQWLKGEGQQWIQKVLNTPYQSKQNTFQNRLTQINLLGSIGGAFQIMIRSDLNKPTIANLFDLPLKDLEQVLTDYTTNIRHKEFDSEKLRARQERNPLLLQGHPLSSKENPQQLVNAFDHGLGFGQIFHPSTMDSETAAHYEAAEKAAGGRQALPRQGQPIQDLSRIGLISEDALSKMPKAFQKLDLLKDIQQLQLTHGAGVNRWRLTGEFPQHCRDQGFPVAGTQSGNAAVAILFLNLASNGQFSGSDHAHKLGLYYPAMLNICGHHALCESSILFHAAADKTKLDLRVPKDLYGTILHQVHLHTLADKPDSYFKALREA